MSNEFQISDGLREETFSQAQFTISTDTLIRNILHSLPTGNYRWPNDKPRLIHSENQLWFFLQAYVSAEILRNANLMGVVAERELTTLAPKKVRNAAISSLKNNGLIESTMHKKSVALKLTDAGKQFLKINAQ